MPYNMWDLSNIIMSNRAGENIANGMVGAASAVSDGIQKGREIKEQRKRYTTMLEAADPSGAKAGKYQQASLGELQGHVDSFAMKRAKQIDEQAAAAAAQESQLRAQQLRESQARMAQREREMAAFQSATAPRTLTPQEGYYVSRNPTRQPSVAEMIQTYGQSGGSNPEMLQALKSMQPKPDPKFITDPASGIRIGVDASGNMQQLKAPEAPKSALDEVVFDGGVKYRVDKWGNYWTPQGQPVQKPVAPKSPDPLLARSDPELYAIQRKEYMDYYGKSSNLAESDSTPSSLAKDQPRQISSLEELEKLAKGTRFTWNGKTLRKK